ncbi:MAG TPA: hypothetical protein VJ697_14515 [Nitrososphaeraceae archaeon]|nr:hypothetical protein [Nitrososphaeraceae archaeon]
MSSQDFDKSDLTTSDIIGKTIQFDKYQITMDEFWFSIFEDIIIAPFDFISVENIQDTVTIGIVKELRTVRNSEITILQQILGPVDNRLIDNTNNSKNNVDQGIRIARVAVMTNTQIQNLTSNSKTKFKDNIRMPVNIDKAVRFANEKEIFMALGIPKMEDPVMGGVIQMSNGQKFALPIAMSYLAGPDTAHINATGISGNLKTSYVMFLLHSMYQKLIKNHEVAIIIFNTREDDLLDIHEREGGELITEKDNELYEVLEISPDPFDNVTYFLPRGKDGKPISIHIPPNFRTYSYELKDIYDRLDLLLSSESYDPRYNLYAIINYIYESWPLEDSSSNNVVNSWSDLLKYTDYPQEIVGHKSMYLHFLGYIQKFKRSPLFTDKRKTSIYIGNEIKKIKADDVFVIDIAMIHTLEEQSLVIGDVMKNIDELFSSRYSFENSLNETESQGEKNTKLNKKPKYILIFIDEINRFLPQVSSLGHRSSVAEQIIKTIIAGKSRNTILLSAQQFKSAVDPILHENTGIHMIAKLGLSELSTNSYSMLDIITKGNIAQMGKGEIVMIQPAIRHPVKVVFPRPPFKRISR